MKHQDIESKRLLPKITTGERIRLIRERKFLTQRGMARLLGCATSTLHRWEVGRTSPPFDKVEAIAIICDVSILFFCEYHHTNLNP